MYAKKHPRRGYRRAYHDASGERRAVSHMRIQRLWHEEGLRVPQQRRPKRVGSSTVDAPAAVAPNLVWAVDFQFDADEQGRAIDICSIVDERTRECTGVLVDRSITPPISRTSSPSAAAETRLRPGAHKRRDG